MNNDIVLYANGKEYHCVLGCTITEEFNETLDSATLILDNVQKEDRLQINPYDFVRIKNIGDGYSLDKEMLIDSFVETEKNISQHIYYYQIELMSETKLLEKKQLPNLTISHSERYGKKSIAQHIMNYMDLYVPRAKMISDKTTLSWSYQPIITYDKEALEEKFGEECADMVLSAPTLRQALTNLMLQKGCIPLVENRKLGWLDLTTNTTVFDEEADGLNAMQRSNSSDSYVNALANMSEQLLDTDNEVISETVGFRDPDNVFIKQAENLKLHTSFPIYKVTKCLLSTPFYTNSYVRVKNKNFYETGKWYPAISVLGYTTDGRLASLTNTRPMGYFDVYHQKGIENVTIKNAKLVFLSQEYSTSVFSVYKTVDFEVGDVNSSSSYVQTRVSVPDELATEEGAKNYYFYITMTVVRGTGEEITQSTMLLLLDNAYMLNTKASEYDYEIKSLPVPFIYLKLDLTPCVVESSKRQLLDTDFTTMPTSGTASELAKWVYSTVSYSIGGQEITGFSQTYTQAKGWWSESKTYFENILNVLVFANNAWHSDEELQEATVKAYRNSLLGGYDGAFEVRAYSYVSQSFASSIFDITYQPLNSMTHKTYKKESLFDLEQLDNTATGLTDFDRFAKNSQQKVNRLGNDIMSINQTTDDANAIQPLNSEYDISIVFKRTIALNKNYIQITYNLSKDYVIKNYFTSISTKYRAYEHIDYKQATIRKEHMNVFVTLDTEKHSNMSDDRAIFAGVSANVFFGGLLPHDESDKVRYALEQSVNEQGNTETVKYDISVVASNGTLSFVYQPWFNIGNGSYLTALTATEGGLPQSYQVWGSEYYEKRQVGFASYIDFYSDHTDNGILKIAKEPIVDNSYFLNLKIKLVDDLTTPYLTQHKDEGEILNNTLQCTYVNKANSHFVFTEELIRTSPFACITQYGYANALVLKTNFKQNKNNLKPYPNQDGAIYGDEDTLLDIKDYVSIDGNAITFQKGLLMNPYKIVHAYKNANNEWEWVDIAYYEGDKTRTYYVYENSTNTLKVMCEDDYGVLRPMYEDDGTGKKTAKAL